MFFFKITKKYAFYISRAYFFDLKYPIIYHILKRQTNDESYLTLTFARKLILQNSQ